MENAHLLYVGAAYLAVGVGSVGLLAATLWQNLRLNRRRHILFRIRNDIRKDRG